MSLSSVQFLLLFLISISALYTDFKSNKIYNVLCILGFVSALVFHVISAGPTGALLHVAGGTAIALAIFFPFYVMGGMAAGDVKFMATCCAILGWPASLFAVGATLVVGMILSITYVVVRGGLTQLIYRFERIFAAWFQMTATSSITTETVVPSLDRNPQRRELSKDDAFPYALAIVAGSFIALVWGG